MINNNVADDKKYTYKEYYEMGLKIAKGEEITENETGRGNSNED